MVTGLRLSTLLLCATVVASLIAFVVADCSIDWNRPNQLKIRNSQYEVRFSGAALRIFALMPSGRPYEEEFAQFELVQTFLTFSDQKFLVLSRRPFRQIRSFARE
jgi:hypothetical protein